MHKLRMKPLLTTSLARAGAKQCCCCCLLECGTAFAAVNIVDLATSTTTTLDGYDDECC